MASKKGVWNFLVIMIAFMVLTGCSTIGDEQQNPESTPTPIIVVDAQATEVIPPTTPTPEPPAATSTTEAVATSEPLPTAVATATEVGVVEPTQEAEPSATPSEDTSGDTVSEFPSSTSAWVATTTYDTAPFPNEIMFALRNTETDETIVVEQLTATGDDPIPYAPFPMAWDQAGETIYYTHYPVYMDGCAIYADGSALYGYSVTTHSGGMLNERAGFYFKFSPDATQVAYLPSNSTAEVSTIAVYNTANDTLQEVPLDTTIVADPADEVMADIHWHPTRPLAVLDVRANVCIGPGVTSLVLLDSETMVQTKLELDAPNGFMIDGWEGDDNQILRIRVDVNTLLKYDLDSGVWIAE